MATATAPALAAAPASDENINKLREVMRAADSGRGVHAYIVPTEDPHMSEYAPDCFKRREFISKFTGSAGTAVITLDKAALWTDGRYFLQGEKELGADWQLMRAGTPGCPEVRLTAGRLAGRPAGWQAS
jgi:Xaa-Pro aminopeptidase